MLEGGIRRLEDISFRYLRKIVVADLSLFCFVLSFNSLLNLHPR